MAAMLSPNQIAASTATQTGSIIMITTPWLVVDRLWAQVWKKNRADVPIMALAAIQTNSIGAKLVNVGCHGSSTSDTSPVTMDTVSTIRVVSASGGTP